MRRTGAEGLVRRLGPPERPRPDPLARGRRVVRHAAVSEYREYVQTIDGLTDSLRAAAEQKRNCVVADVNGVWLTTHFFPRLTRTCRCGQVKR